MPICGAKKKDGSQCQNRVSEAGQRCHHHSRNKASAIWSRILTACETIATIAGTAEGIQWAYEHAWPYVAPLWNSGLFCPERFWWDSLALPMQRGEPRAEIHLKLKAVLQEMHRDEKDIEDKLADYSEPDRERIADAYAKLFAEIRAHYPHLANGASVKAR